jgi:hypothetical protein
VTSNPGQRAGDGNTSPDTRRGVRVELTFPWDPELLSLARLTASTVASRLDFTIEDVEDVRLAIDELCMACADGAGPDSRVQLCFEHDGQTLSIQCTIDHVRAVSGAGGEDVLAGMTAGELARRILNELVDTYQVGAAVAGTRTAYLEKRRTATSA